MARLHETGGSYMHVVHVLLHEFSRTVDFNLNTFRGAPGECRRLYFKGKYTQQEHIVVSDVMGHGILLVLGDVASAAHLTSEETRTAFLDDLSDMHVIDDQSARVYAGGTCDRHGRVSDKTGWTSLTFGCTDTRPELRERISHALLERFQALQPSHADLPAAA
jgi:hypothetical protein